MKHSVTKINRTFKIKVFGFQDGKKVNTLVGVSGLIRIIGLEFADKFVNKAMAGKGQKEEFKLRRGIKVTFYAC